MQSSDMHSRVLWCGRDPFPVQQGTQASLCRRDHRSPRRLVCMCMYKAEWAAAADDSVEGGRHEGACGLAFDCVAGWHRLVVALFADAVDWGNLGWQEAKSER